MKKIVLTAMLLAVVVACQAAGFTVIVEQHRGPVEGTLVHRGDKAPGFVVEMTDGTTVNSVDLKGKVVLLNFWATWCPPCLLEMQRVPNDIIARFGDNSDFVFLPISRGETREKVMQFREQNGYTFPMGLDPDSKIYNKYAEQSIPRNYLIGRDGKIIVAEIGYSPEQFDELTRMIATLLETN